MKSWFNRSAKHFDDVTEMVTRKLPIPDIDDDDKYVQFVARRDENGYWAISSRNNVHTVTEGIEHVSRAFQSALHKHLSESLNASQTKRQKQGEMTFDNAFIILRDLEKSVLAHAETLAAGAEPKNHFMAAWRLMPPKLQTRLNTETEYRDTHTHTPLFPSPKKDKKPPPPQALN